jgi:hypothetical protein
MHKLFTLLVITLFSFPLCGMEKDNPIRIRENMYNMYDAAEDRNADLVMKAIMNKKPISEITNLLNSLKININFHVKEGWPNQKIYTILRCALEHCDPNKAEDVALISLILKKGAKNTLNQQLSVNGWEPYLFYATENAINHNMNLKIVKLLIDNGADVNFRFVEEKERGRSALHWALMRFEGDTKCIDYLLENGADTNIFDYAGRTPLGILAYRLDCLMASAKAKESKFMPNLKLFELAIEKLLVHGADINKKQKAIFNKISNYESLKPFFLNLDAIIKKAKDRKKQKNIATDLKVALEKEVQANRSINICGRDLKLNEEIVIARCPELFLRLDPWHKKKGDLVIKEID